MDEDTLAVDVIAEGADTGNYLASDHTASHFRDQFWFPGLLDRYRHGEWADAGRATTGDRIHDKVRKIIAEHRAPALENGLTADLDRIVSE